MQSPLPNLAVHALNTFDICLLYSNTSVLCSIPWALNAAHTGSAENAGSATASMLVELLVGFGWCSLAGCSGAIVVIVDRVVVRLGLVAGRHPVAHVLVQEWVALCDGLPNFVQYQYLIGRKLLLDLITFGTLVECGLNFVKVCFFSPQALLVILGRRRTLRRYHHWDAFRQWWKVLVQLHEDLWVWRWAKNRLVRVLQGFRSIVENCFFLPRYAIILFFFLFVVIVLMYWFTALLLLVFLRFSLIFLIKLVQESCALGLLESFLEPGADLRFDRWHGFHHPR